MRSRFLRSIIEVVLVSLLAVVLSGCSIKKLAINSLADTLAGTGSIYTSDGDPDFIREAIPFSLKTVEGLLMEAPKHTGLLETAASGFAFYAYAYLEADAREVENEDIRQAGALQIRARRMYQRALGYALRGLEVAHPGIETQLRTDPVKALEVTSIKDVPFLYWVGVTWGAMISLSKKDPDVIADQNIVEAVMRRVLELDEDYQDGAVHEFFIVFEGSRSDAAGGSLEKARIHFERALELAKGRKASPFISYAETVSVTNQDREEFRRLLQQALDIDPDQTPDTRLLNLISQRRARWLLDHEEDLFY
ncbi:MAG: TRAP transporter TatT component family protein [Nitrososphaera sp.]|nr:TRAP transporter TatT component family protein [Nitrososphaera sp.]